MHIILERRSRASLASPWTSLIPDFETAFSRYAGSPQLGAKENGGDDLEFGAEDGVYLGTHPILQ
jgi:hypothetical protein